MSAATGTTGGVADGTETALATPPATPRASTRRAWAAALALGLIVLALLLPQLAADPRPGLTVSNAPFTDEGFNTVNARSLVLLGTPSTDDWNRHLVMPTATALDAVSFAIAGTGINGARLPAVVLTVLATVLLVLTVRNALGTAAGAVAGAGFATSALVVGYGHLAFLEPLMVGMLALGVFAATRPTRRPAVLGFVAGLALVAAIGAKLLAVLPVAAVIGVVLLLAIRQPAERRRLGGLVLGFAVAAVPWLLVIAANWPQVRTVLATFPALGLTLSPGTLVHRAVAYVRGADDHALTLTWPLIVAGGLGLVAGLARWRSLSPAARALLLGAAAWALLTFGELAAVEYRPNRYFVTVIPALAILAGFGVPVALGWLGRRPAPVRATVAALAIGLLAGPGLVVAGPWASSGASTLPAIQARVAAAVPRGSAVYGAYAATFAMAAPVAVITPWKIPDFNAGDLYVTRGVRWLVLADGEEPEWMTAHADAWAARRVVECDAWGPHQVCLLWLPG